MPIALLSCTAVIVISALARVTEIQKSGGKSQSSHVINPRCNSTVPLSSHFPSSWDNTWTHMT